MGIWAVSPRGPLDWYAASASMLYSLRLRGARVTGLPPVKGFLTVTKSLTAAGAVFAPAARAHRYLVSRSMTSMEMSSVMASIDNAELMATPFSGGTTPEPSDRRCACNVVEPAMLRC